MSSIFYIFITQILSEGLWEGVRILFLFDNCLYLSEMIVRKEAFSTFEFKFCVIHKNSSIKKKDEIFTHSVTWLKLITEMSHIFQS